MGNMWIYLVVLGCGGGAVGCSVAGGIYFKKDIRAGLVLIAVGIFAAFCLLGFGYLLGQGHPQTTDFLSPHGVYSVKSKLAEDINDGSCVVVKEVGDPNSDLHLVRYDLKALPDSNLLRLQYTKQGQKFISY